LEIHAYIYLAAYLVFLIVVVLVYYVSNTLSFCTFQAYVVYGGKGQQEQANQHTTMISKTSRNTYGNKPSTPSMNTALNSVSADDRIDGEECESFLEKDIQVCTYNAEDRIDEQEGESFF
jgi:hypothetical protein